MLKHKKILIVDDEQEAVWFFAKFLKKRGYEVVTAHTGQDGVALAQKFMPHLAIIDLGLPDMDGSDVAVKIMEAPLLKETRIMFITGTLTDEEGGKIDLIGNRYVLTKPCEVDKILEVVERLIGAGQE